MSRLVAFQWATVVKRKFYVEFEKFYMKIIVIRIPKILVAKSHLFFCLALLKTKIKNQILRRLVVW